ncbi:hypothetical protein QBC32DRAFT_343340 [Pseudoneurospora amorphoporcata]|uniref:Uncharacterized protein n=1 Tax=Pseudoneurospora amorphoporcata TaxID=241081 RepID=A0AAN6SFI2_9PEZI|nr:hypothetical protein QBC32DRAFT_343340 [Pseudoneurospora amorphoporcata]
MKRVVAPIPNEVLGDNVNSAQIPTLSDNAPKEQTGDQAPSFSNTRPNPILGPALQLGAGVGTLGLLTGAAAGIIRSAPVGLYAATTGIQWFVLSSSFWGSRQFALNSLAEYTDASSSRNNLIATSTAGAFSGATAGLLRGPRNVIPGAIVFSLLGLGGATLQNKLKSREQSESWFRKVIDGKWSPITRITNEDWERILEEKLLRVETEIAVLDDSIEELRKNKKQA